MVGEPKTHGDSETRYMLLHDTFKLYEDTNAAISADQVCEQQQTSDALSAHALFRSSFRSLSRKAS